jgi:PPOX class probable F420-dependent enzyme
VFDLDSPAGERLRTEQILWLTTVRADGQPQTSPVWFVWDGEGLLVFSQPHAQKLRNLAANPRVSAHLDADGGGVEAVNVEGTATIDPRAPSSDRLGAYQAKYREGIRALGWTPAELAWDYSVAIRIVPVRARAW